MNFNNFTIKAQEAVQHAFQVAEGHQQQAVEPGHLLKGLFHTSENIAGFLLNKTGADIRLLHQVTDRIIQSYPRVSGGEAYISTALNRVFRKSLEYAQEMSDQFVSVEHLLLGLIDSGDQIGQVLKDNGIGRDEFKKAILELRKGSKVNSQTAEDRFDSLNRFAVNLNEKARSGKLDPVIGRDEEIRRILQILSRRTKIIPC